MPNYTVWGYDKETGDKVVKTVYAGSLDDARASVTDTLDEVDSCIGLVEDYTLNQYKD